MRLPAGPNRRRSRRGGRSRAWAWRRCRRIRPTSRQSDGRQGHKSDECEQTHHSHDVPHRLTRRVSATLTSVNWIELQRERVMDEPIGFHQLARCVGVTAQCKTLDLTRRRSRWQKRRVRFPKGSTRSRLSSPSTVRNPRCNCHPENSVPSYSINSRIFRPSSSLPLKVNAGDLVPSPCGGG